MWIREYKPADCAQLAELCYQTVHSVNAKDYTEEQLLAMLFPPFALFLFNCFL